MLGNAFRAYASGDYDGALRLAKRLDRARLINRDYADYVIGQSAFLTGDYRQARTRFERLQRDRSSRFADVSAWRLADCDWQLGNREAARKSYERLLARGRKRRWKSRDGDLAVAQFRIAAAHQAASRTPQALAGYRKVLEDYPAHPLATRAADAARALRGGDEPLSPAQRIARAERLTDAHLWREAISELDRIGDDIPTDVARRRDYQMGRTLFKMRRQYELAGRLLLSVYEHMGADKTWALFHGARGLSRAHLDEEAIGWYTKLVKDYPRSDWAPEAQYLSGWLHFNLGNYRKAIGPLQAARDRYPRSKWAAWALWYQSLSHYLLGEYEKALPLFERLAKKAGKLEGGKGRYWAARTKHRLGRKDEAIAEYRDLVGRYPFSWYAQLSRSRLQELGIDIGPFGDDPRDPGGAPDLDAKPDPKLARDPLIQRVDELLAADLDVEAGEELRRGEKSFVKRHGRAKGLAMVLDRYRRATNFNRPWMIAVVYGGSRALDAPPTGRAKLWWQHAYPLAYRALVEKHRGLGNNPPYYLYSIMRKESGFDPHTVSYADALGLLQMIPPTTRRVAPQVGMTYTDDLLFDPENNIKAGSWYIGRLFAKFKGQVPIAAASYNAGPGPVMRWLDANGDREIDEYVELISFSQARGYGKKVTETYARYLYLYEGEDYRQPLAIDRKYVDNELTY